MSTDHHHDDARHWKDHAEKAEAQNMKSGLMIPVIVIDRPSREGDHLFLAEHEGRQLVGAVSADWQLMRLMKTQGLPKEELLEFATRMTASAEMGEGWESPPGGGDGDQRCTGSVELSRDSARVGDIEVRESQGRPVFATPENVRFPVTPTHGDDAAVENVRTWYEAAWTLVSMAQLIEAGVDVRTALLESGREGTRDFQDVEAELSQARLSITRAKAVLKSYQ